MKNLQTYANRPMTEFPEFWTEDWLKLAIDELDTRLFSAEQYERYAITLAYNASAIEMERVNTLKVRTEEREKAKAEADVKEKEIILEMEIEGFTIKQIAKITKKTEEEVQQIIAKNTK